MTNHSPRTRVSRETRRLLTASLVALLALWVLARIRFPDQPPTPSPIPSLLSQLSAAPRFSNLAGEVAELRTRLSESWLALPLATHDPTGTGTSRVAPAIRFRPDAALLLLRSGDRLLNPDDVLTTDGATGLTVVRTSGGQASPVISAWVPSTLDTPRYLMITVSTPGTVSLRPVLVEALHEVKSPAWPGPIWALPRSTDVVSGSFVFTTTGDLAGLVVDESPVGMAIVPWDVVIEEAARLLERPSTTAVDIGVQVQSLSPGLARATGAKSGIVVTWVDRNGPASTRLAVGDVIESLNDQPMTEAREWQLAIRRIPAGTAALRIRRHGVVDDVELPIAAPDGETSSSPLGLTLRDRAGVGAVVVEVDPGSAADDAGVMVGDVITLAARLRAPTAMQVARTFQTATEGSAVMLAITRGDRHLVTAVTK